MSLGWSAKFIIPYCCSVAKSCLTLCIPMNCSMPGFSVLHSLPEFAQTHVHWLSNAIHCLILCHPLLLLPSIFPSIRVFSNELVLHIRWPKYWHLSFIFSPSNEYSWLISFRIDQFDLLAVEGTLKSLLQPHNSKASILQYLTFFMVQLSHPYMTTGNTIALTLRTFDSKAMSLLFKMLSRFVITFLPRSKWLLTLWLLSLSKVILEPEKIKPATASTFSPEWHPRMPWS